MKKTIFALAMVAVMLMATPALAAGVNSVTDPGDPKVISPEVPAANDQADKVYVKEVELDKTAITNADGVQLLPLRAIAEAFDYKVSWNQAGKTVTIDTGKEIVTLTINSKAYTIGSKSGEMAAAPLLSSGTTYVSEDFIAKAMGCDVDFDGWRISIAGLADLGAADATYELKKGETFTIGLEENTTTGYAWSHNADKQGLSLVREDINTADIPDNMAGTPSFRIWQFKAEQAGTYKLTFVYDRSFSPSDEPLSYTYTIIVK